MNLLKKFPEYRLLAWLGIIVIGWHLLTLASAFLTLFADVFLLLILSWILAFVLEPLVTRAARSGLGRIWAAGAVYLGLAIAGIILIWVILPTIVAQITQLASLVPSSLPADSLVTSRVESFLANTAANSVTLASGIVSSATGLLLVFILSFYLLISRSEIAKFLLEIVPKEYEEDYLFLEKTISRTFASFLQVQVVLGLAIGIITFLTLIILRVDFALSTAALAALLAMVPVVGPILFLIPVILAALTVSLQKMFFAVAILILAAQLVYNLLAPKLLSTALKIHPVIVLLSFLIGYKLAGVWGAVFAVPIVSAGAIISKELLKYWKKEADK